MIACRRAMKAGRAPGARCRCRSRWRRRGGCWSAARSAPPSCRSPRCGPTCSGINCATGPGRDAGAPALPVAALAVPDQRAAQRRPAEHRRRAHPLRPHAGGSSPSSIATTSPISASAIVGGCCGTTPEHLRQVVEAVRDIEPAPALAEFEPSVTSIYSPVTLEQDLSVLIIGERTNANGSKAFRDAMLAGDWDTCVKMANEQIREGAHVLDVCVDYVGRDGTVDMDEIAKRFATQASVPLVLDSTEPQVLEAALMHVGGRAILNSANLEDGELPGSRMDRVFSLARDYGAAVICLLIDERGQARDVEWKMEIAHRINEIATERYGLSSTDLIFDALTFPLSTGDDDLRRDAIETIEAIRRIKAEIPGASTTLGLSQRQLRPLPRRAPRPEQRVPPRVRARPGSTRRSSTPARSCRCNRLPDEQREVCLDLVWDRRAPGYDPLQKLLEVFADVKVGEGREAGPQRHAGRRAAQAAASSTATARASPTTSTRRWRRHAGALDRQRGAARRHEGRRRAVRLRPDAAAVRAAVGGDDEGRGRLSRAAHGPRRRRRRRRASSSSPR